MRVKPIVNVLRYSDPDRLMLAKNAAVFLGKEDADNIRRPLTLLRKKHTSIFRGENIDFEFFASKPVYDHIITYTTQQRRACAGLRANRAGDFVVPLEVEGTDLGDRIELIGQDHLRDYNSLIDGIDPETQDPIQKARLQAARSVAPMSVNLHFTFQFNFLTLMEAIFPKRIWEPGAQPDTQEIAQIMWEAVRPFDPELWDTAYDVFGPEAISWDKSRHTINKRKTSLIEFVGQVLEKHVPEDYRFTVVNGNREALFSLLGDLLQSEDRSLVKAILEKYAPKGSMWD